MRSCPWGFGPGFQREAIPLLLTLTGAGVDAMVILGFNALTAARTGNTVLLAVAIARGDAVTGLSAAVSVAAFAVGCFLGKFSIHGRLNPSACIRHGGLNKPALGYSFWSLTPPPQVRSSSRP